MDFTGPAGAQLAVAIVDHELGYRAEQPFARGAYLGDRWDHQGCKPRADQIRNAPFRRGHSKNLVGGFYELAGKGNSLSLVTIQQLFRRALLQYRRQLPREIDRIADTGIHALPTGRTVDVCGIAKQQRAGLPE